MSNDDNGGVVTLGGKSPEELKDIVRRVENIERQIKDLREDISEIFKDAKNQGFDVKTIKQIVKLRKKDSNEIAQEEALLELYLSALGLSKENIDTTAL